jgi:Cd(II)/Pb(II)-responsive transcriptional regulator
MKIGELASRTGCKVETIRYYEQIGLLPEPKRTDGNYRNYDQDHLNRLQFIRNCRSLDMTHTEIVTLIHFLETPQDKCYRVNDVVDEHIAHVLQRIKELNSLYAQLTQLRAKCKEPKESENCPILQKLSAVVKTNTNSRPLTKSDFSPTKAKV